MVAQVIFTYFGGQQCIDREMSILSPPLSRRTEHHQFHRPYPSDTDANDEMCKLRYRNPTNTYWVEWEQSQTDQQPAGPFAWLKGKRN